MVVHGSIGYQHSVFVDGDGAVWTAGRGDLGQLGLGNWEDSQNLERVEGLPPCRMASAGKQFTACLSRDGEVYCFGMNAYGQLGQGHRTNLASPHQVSGLPSIRSLACGTNYTVCVGEDCSMWVFGAEATTPWRQTGIQARQVACSATHFVVLTTNGTVYLYATAHPFFSEYVFYPRVIDDLPVEVDSVHCGDGFTILMGIDGSLWSSGRNDFGQLGLGHRYYRLPFEKIFISPCKQVSCGSHHVVAVDHSDNLWGWGFAQNHRLDKKSYRLFRTPIEKVYYTSPERLRRNVRYVLTGFAHTIVKNHRERVKAAGFGDCGQLCTNQGFWGKGSHWSSTQITADMVGDEVIPSSRAKSARSAIYPSG